MAKLITCGTCGHQVSSTATQCPNCGQKFKKKTSIFTWAVAGLIGVPFLFGIFKSASQPTQTVSEQPIQETSSTVKNEKFNPNLNEIKADPHYKKTRTMDYQTCLTLQDIYTQHLGKNKKVIEMQKTNISLSKKYCVVDGAILVTCDGKQNKMTIAKTNSKGCK